MLRSNTLKKSVGVFLILLVFVTMANSLAAARVMPASAGPAAVETICHGVSHDSANPDRGDFKPPKQSFVDYDIFFTCTGFKPTTRHSASFSVPDIGRKALSGALDEILIPPKI